MDNLPKKEAQLQKLFKSSQEDNRYEIAHQWKKQGGKVIGFLSDAVPEEIIHAAGMLPLRIMGTWRGDIAKALVYKPINSDSYGIHVIESLLEGRFDFLDGVIIPHLDDDQRRIWDIWKHMGKTPFVYDLYIPRKDTDYCILEFKEGLERLKRTFSLFQTACFAILRQKMYFRIKCDSLTNIIYQ